MFSDSNRPVPDGLVRLTSPLPVKVALSPCCVVFGRNLPVSPQLKVVRPSPSESLDSPPSVCILLHTKVRQARAARLFMVFFVFVPHVVELPSPPLQKGLVTLTAGMSA